VSRGRLGGASAPAARREDLHVRAGGGLRSAPSWARSRRTATSPSWCSTPGWRPTEAGRTQAFDAIGRRLERCATPARRCQGTRRRAVRRGLRDRLIGYGGAAWGALRDFVAEVLELEGAVVEPFGAGRARRAGSGCARRPDGGGRSWRGSASAPSCRATSIPIRPGGRLARPLRRPARRARPAGANGNSRCRPARRNSPIPSGCSNARSTCPTRVCGRFHAVTAHLDALPAADVPLHRVCPTRSAKGWSGSDSISAPAPVLDEVLARLLPSMAAGTDWQAPRNREVRLAAGPGWDAATLERRVRPLLDVRVREALRPFLHAMRLRPRARP